MTWTRASLEEISDSIDYGHTASAKFHGKGPKFLRITDIQDGKVEWNTVPHCDWSDRDQAVSRLEEGDIVFARTGATTGKSFLLRSVPRDAIFASYLIRVRPRRAMVEPGYLARFFESADYWAQVYQRSSGTAQGGVNASKLKSLSIPLPPLPEQRRIATILDKADVLRAKRREAITKLDQLLQSVFLEIFGDPVINSRNWPLVRFGSITESRLGKMLDEKRREGEYMRPYLANVNVQWGRFELENLRLMNFSPADQDEFGLRYGDLLMCEGGEPGRCAIWREQLTGCYYQKALHRVRCDPRQCVPEFVQWLFWFLAQAGAFRSSIAVATIAHLPGIKLKALQVPLPPLTLQNKFAKHAGSIERQKKLLKGSAKQLDALFASLQDRAFSGTL